MLLRRKATQNERKILAGILRSHRVERKLTQQQLAELLDCSCHWISDIERGRSDPAWQDILRWMAVVGMEPQEFVQAAGMGTPGEMENDENMAHL